MKNPGYDSSHHVLQYPLALFDPEDGLHNSGRFEYCSDIKDAEKKAEGLSSRLVAVGVIVTVAWIDRLKEKPSKRDIAARALAA